MSDEPDKQSGRRWRSRLRKLAEDTERKSGQSDPKANRKASQLVAAMILVTAVTILLPWLLSHSRERVPYQPTFVEQVRAGNVKKITSRESTINGSFVRAVSLSPDGKGKKVKKFKTEVPPFVDRQAFAALLRERHVVVTARRTMLVEQIQEVVWWLAPMLIVTVLLVMLLATLSKKSERPRLDLLGGFGRARVRGKSDDDERVRFTDVAGIDEAKEQLTEIVDFLREPERYSRLGARVPRGVLLSGLPGTGKTLLAKALAGEADVPFFSMSASEFVEAIVGVGASRVRDLFQQAKDAAPAIIFIDELDAVGRSRATSSGLVGGDSEREQTLNQILTEMDGFAPDAGVIVLGATNRPEVLDSALLRAGRFDRRVAVHPPDRRGRVRILEVHTRGKPLDDDVDLEEVAAATPGMVGADLANVCNEAALLAARRERDHITAGDIADALEKVILGAERQLVMTGEARRRTAYHEAGHAIVSMLTPGADPVRKVSIIPRGMALGVTMLERDDDRFFHDREYLLGVIKVSLGGRAAERVVYGDTTSGAESDIQQLTRIARLMVGSWGMSDAIGPVAVVPSQSAETAWYMRPEVSEHLQQTVDTEVRKLVEKAEAEVLDLIAAERDKLDAMVAALMERETLDREEAYASVGLTAPAVTDLGHETTEEAEG